MKYKNILVTGGAGFVGSNICIKLKQHYPSINVSALDNLMRRGSELNLLRLQKYGVKFIHGDVRNKEDLQTDKVDLLIECSAEPSVLAGITSTPEYLLNTNLLGAINCLELVRKNNAAIVFLSTSRVYPIQLLNKIKFTEEETRFSLVANQSITGISQAGINETFPLDGIRSLYGTTKLAAELIIQEYIATYGIKGVINRFGLITGPWQMGKVDQGVIVLWMARHIFKKPLSYIGFGGSGKQVRDAIHIDDAFDIILKQIQNIDKFNGQLHNIGGGKKNSVSLLELTNFCQKITKEKVLIKKNSKNRPADIRIYISDNSKIYQQTGWKPKKTLDKTLEDIYKWIKDNKKQLETILE